MRKYLKILAIAGGLAAAPALAQDTDTANGAEARAEMSPEQNLAYGTWPEERRALYDAWPVEAQSYYWTLTPPRQEVFWMLSDGDRLTLVGMSEADRDTAWSRLEDQMLASQPPVGAEPSPSPDGMSQPGESPMPEPDGTSDETIDGHGPR